MSSLPTVRIGNRLVGSDHAPFVIAEAGVNHNGDAATALKLVDAAAEIGADAVKFQIFSADALASDIAPLAEYQKASGDSRSQRQMLRALELSVRAVEAAQRRAEQRGIIWFATPFDFRSVDLLARLNVPAFKVGSGDLTNLPLLRAVAHWNLPLIVSTGMATMSEVDSAVADLRSHGDPPLIILHCVSAYPSPPSDANLRAMATLRRRFKVPVGFSDHTTGIGVAVAAAALGAAVIEKHLTLDRSMPGPDHAASLDPQEFERMLRSVHEAYDGLGDGKKTPRPIEEDVRAVARRSIVAARELPTGHVLSIDDLSALRPGFGISPLRIDSVVGRRLAKSIAAGEMITPDAITPRLE